MLDLDDLPQPRLRVMRLIATALMLGVLSFLAIAVLIVQGKQNAGNQGPAGQVHVVTWVSVGVLVVNVVLSFILPGVGLRAAVTQRAASSPDTAPRDDDLSLFLSGAQTAMILSLAPLEGAAFLGLVAYLVEARLLALVVAGVALLLMLANYPTDARVRARLEQQREMLAEARRQAG